MAAEVRLADALVEWMRRARERRVYVEYRFEGAGDPMEDRVALSICALVEEAIDAASRPEPDERWMDLIVERGAQGLAVECAAAGDLTLPAKSLYPGQTVALERYEDSFRLRVEQHPQIFRMEETKWRCRE